MHFSRRDSRPSFQNAVNPALTFEKARWTSFTFNLRLFLTSLKKKKQVKRHSRGERGCWLALVETKQFVPRIRVMKIVSSQQVYRVEGSVRGMCQGCFPVFTEQQKKEKWRVCGADNILQQISCFWANPRLILGKALFCPKKSKD